MRDFFNYSYPELVGILEEDFGASAYRATQLFEWVYRKGVTDFGQMTNISQKLRDQFAEAFYFPSAKIH